MLKDLSYLIFDIIILSWKNSNQSNIIINGFDKVMSNYYKR